MRLLLLHEGKALRAVVRRLAPSDAEILEVHSFAQAAACLRDDPPDAAILDLTPMPLPWWKLQELCSSHEPPIPVLFESCVHETAEEAGLAKLDRSASFLAKPYDLADLQAEVDRLVGAAHPARGAGRAEAESESVWQPAELGEIPQFPDAGGELSPPPEVSSEDREAADRREEEAKKPSHASRSMSSPKRSAPPHPDRR